MKSDDPFSRKAASGDHLSIVSIQSNELGLIGVCDMVEFVPSSGGVKLAEREGLFQPVPVEYKRG